MVCTRSPQTFSLKGLRVNVLGFATHMVSAIAIYFCCCIAQAATENTQPNECGRVPVKGVAKKVNGRP